MASLRISGQLRGGRCAEEERGRFCTRRVLRRKPIRDVTRRLFRAAQSERRYGRILGRLVDATHREADPVFESRIEGRPHGRPHLEPVRFRPRELESPRVGYDQRRDADCGVGALRRSRSHFRRVRRKPFSAESPRCRRSAGPAAEVARQEDSRWATRVGAAESRRKEGDPVPDSLLRSESGCTVRLGGPAATEVAGLAGSI